MWGNEVNTKQMECNCSHCTTTCHNITMGWIRQRKIQDMVVQRKRERHGLLIVYAYNVHNCKCHMSQLENTKHYDERDAEYN